MKKRISALVLFGLFIISALSTTVTAQSQYQSQTLPITIDTLGTFSGIAQNMGVAFEIQGTPGATGSVTTQLYADNPQPTATIPEEVDLEHFLIITFNMDPNDFTQATIYITYTDAEVASIQEPYVLYKYSPNTNSYNPIQATVDTASKLIIVTVNSVNDPLFAIGGTPVEEENGGVSTLAWVALVASVIIIVLVVLTGIWYLKRRSA